MASLLLGMLMTILTMIFNQSSIAWRIGDASVRDTIGYGEGVADFRHEADNLYPWKGQAYIITSIFGDDGEVLTSREDYIKSGSAAITKVPGKGADDVQESYATDQPPQKKNRGVSGGSSQNGDANYIVNVKSLGPDRKEERYDNIYGVSPLSDTDEW